MMCGFLRKGDTEFGLGANRFYIHAKANHVRMGAPDPELLIFALLEAFNIALAATNDGGKTATMVKNEARAALEKAIRAYVKEFLLNNSKVTDEDRIAMDMTVRKTTRTAVTVPDTIPIVIVITSMVRMLVFKFLCQGQKRAGRPPKVSAFVLRWAILDHFPSGIAELVNVTTATRSPLTLLFGDKDRGKTLYFVVSWRIARSNLEGPLSEIMMAIVP